MRLARMSQPIVTNHFILPSEALNDPPCVTAGSISIGSHLRRVTPDPTENRVAVVAARDWRMARVTKRWPIALKAGSFLLLVVLAVYKRDLIASSFGVLGRVNWTWLLLAIELESASIATMARMQRRLLAAGGAKVRLLPMVGTTYAAASIGSFIPLAGPQIGAAYTFRRLRRFGADATLAGWAVVLSGIISTAAAGVLFVVGAVVSGNDSLVLAGVSSGALMVVVMAGVACVLWQPKFRRALERRSAGLLRGLARLTRQRVVIRPEAALALFERIAELRLRPRGWVWVVGLAFANWLADAGVLVVSLKAVGSIIPWRGVLLTYALGVAAGGIQLTPGGAGVVEGSLAVSLMRFKVRHVMALASVLLYRLISLWLVAGVGLVLFYVTRQRKRVPRPAPSDAGLPEVRTST